MKLPRSTTEEEQVDPSCRSDQTSCGNSVFHSCPEKLLLGFSCKQEEEEGEEEEEEGRREDQESNKRL